MGGGTHLQHWLPAQRWADGINMWPNAVGTFSRPLVSVYVYKIFVWVLSRFIKMLIKNIFLNEKNKKNKIMIWGIHYFITKLKTKIDVIPRSCFNFIYNTHNALESVVLDLWTFWVTASAEGYFSTCTVFLEIKLHQNVHKISLINCSELQFWTESVIIFLIYKNSIFKYMPIWTTHYDESSLYSRRV